MDEHKYLCLKIGNGWESNNLQVHDLIALFLYTLCMYFVYTLFWHTLCSKAPRHKQMNDMQLCWLNVVAASCCVKPYKYLAHLYLVLINTINPDFVYFGPIRNFVHSGFFPF